jgi:NADPH-dependent 2,4-dienoyl-CoA reductase/sulfur reductase-like enzyme
VSITRVVVVGGGLAGFRAVQALRANGFAGEIVLIGDEVHQPYDRPPLSKQLLAGTFTREQCMLPGEAVDITWRLGVAAVGLDRARSEVVLADDTRLGYDRLIIATGRRARGWPGPVPGSGVHTLRSFEDVVGFEASLGAQAKVIIIGAGFIGCEVAATLRARDLDVTIVDVSPHPMPVLGAEAGQRAVRLHESHGVKFRLGLGVRAIEGDENVEAVVMEDGERLAADAVLVAIGSVPNTEWLVGSGVLLDRGVVVCDATGTVLDDHGHPVEELLAAGDVAAWPNPRASGTVCVEHWSNARDMGDAAATNALLDHGGRSPIRSVPAFWSDQYNVKIKSAGFLRGADTLTLISDDADKPALLIEVSRQGEVVGAIAFNMNRAMIGYQRAFAAALS